MQAIKAYQRNISGKKLQRGVNPIKRLIKTPDTINNQVATDTP